MIVQRYPEPFIAPMRAELSRLGFEDLKTPDAVDAAVKQPGTTMIVVNSVCGCAAGKARPGIALALAKGKRPDHLTTVFAGADVEATQTARDLLRALSAVVAVDRDHEGRQAGLHDGAARDRRTFSRHDRGGVAEGVRNPLLAGTYQKHGITETQSLYRKPSLAAVICVPRDV